MHVNSYFIETLVLCFSCGCENGNLNNGNMNGGTNSTTQCSMNNPSRMIIGKQIQWTDSYGTQCDNSGPFQYDLDAIKQIIQLQFITPPNPTCDSANSHSPKVNVPSLPPLPLPTEPPADYPLPELPPPGWNPPASISPSDVVPFPFPPSLPSIIIPVPSPNPPQIPGEDPGFPVPLPEYPDYPGPPPSNDNNQLPDYILPESPEYPDYPVPPSKNEQPPDYILPESPEYPDYPGLPGNRPSGDYFLPGSTEYPDYPEPPPSNDHQLPDYILPESPEYPGLPGENPPSRDYSPGPGDYPDYPEPSTDSNIADEFQPGPPSYPDYPGLPGENPPSRDYSPGPGDYPDYPEPSTDSNIADENLPGLLPDFPEPSPVFPEDKNEPPPHGGPTPTQPPFIMPDIYIEHVGSHSLNQGDIYDIPPSSSLLARFTEENGAQVQNWTSKHPDGKIVIIISSEAKSHVNWANEVNAMQHTQKEDSFVLIIDWSEYVSPDFALTIKIGFEISKQIVTIIHELAIPADQIVLVGFGSSAHVVGYIGSLTQNIYGATLYQIIALNPTGIVYTGMVEVEHRLSSSDATIVLVIHTEVRDIGVKEPVGTIDVYVNNPEEGQPWCNNDSQCSHESAIDILIWSYKNRPILVTKQETGEILTGFPFNVEVTSVGIYYLFTDPTGSPPKVPGELWPEDPPHSQDWFIDFEKYPGRNVSNILILGEGTGIQQEILIWNQPNPNLMEFLKQNPLAEIFIIITEQSSNTGWAAKLKQTILTTSGSGPKYVIIVDWSMYQFPSYEFTVNAYSNLVAEAVHQLCKTNNIPTGLTEIIGFSTSAHIAGLVGYYVQMDGVTISRITGLDPENRLWNKSPNVRLAEHHATVVQVFHTNTAQFGILEPIGKYDIYFFGGQEQPDCSTLPPDQLHVCSHEKSIDYFILSITNRYLAFEATIQNLLSVRIGDTSIIYGYYLVAQEQNNPIKIYDVNNFLPINDDTEITSIDVEINVEDLESPPVQFVESIPEITLHFHYTIEGPQGLIIQIQTVTYNGRHLGLIQILAGIINLNPDQLTYLLADGEYADNQNNDWILTMPEQIIDVIGPRAVILRIEWTHFKTSYAHAASYSKPIGVIVAQFLAKLKLNVANLHLIGFSIGAHIAGFIGKEIQLITSHPVKRISALDPSRSMFDHAQILDSSRLAPNDATVVDVYHSNIFVYGFTSPLGTADYYINAGFVQPGCGENHMCNHHRATTYFLASMTIKDFALEVEYIGDGNLIFIHDPEFTEFGFFNEIQRPGVYYIRTLETEPFLKNKGAKNIGGIREINIPGEGVKSEGYIIPGQKEIIKINVVDLEPTMETHTEVIQLS